jgi:uncharacterized membrane protein
MAQLKFVMIGQNRQSAFQQAKADHDFTAQELELKTSAHVEPGLHVVRPRGGALRALHVDPRRSPALTGTCPATLPLSANAAGDERP